MFESKTDPMLSSILSDLMEKDITVREKRHVAGGDINETYLLTLSDGSRVFVKENRGKPGDFFTAEATGLAALAATKTIPVAKVIGTGSEGSTLFLFLHYIESAPKASGFWETFGRDLAALHGADASSFVNGGNFGFLRDNYIGATRQVNTPCDTWIDFYRTMRLEKQFEMAAHYFDDTQKSRILRLLDSLGNLLIEPKSPALLHGDLWAGNFMADSTGRAALIDPAVYVGHPEADIAMTELFGGFAPQFYDAYREATPLEPGYRDRRDLYHLYQLLNHLNLFGGSYYGSVMRILMRYS